MEDLQVGGNTYFLIGDNYEEIFNFKKYNNVDLFNFTYSIRI